MNTSEQNETTEDVKKNLEDKYSKVIYMLQTLSLITCALAIPQAALNRETTLVTLIVISVILMIFPMYYMAVVRECMKEMREREKEKKKGDNCEEPAIDPKNKDTE